MVTDLYKPIDLLDGIMELHRNGHIPSGVSSGITSLDGIWRMEEGAFVVVTGTPHSGKSEIMDQIIVDSARNHGWRWGILSPENMPLQRHMAKQIEKWAGRPFGQHDYRITGSEVQRATRELSEFTTYLKPSLEQSYTLEWVLKTMQECFERDGIKGFLLDPWTEMAFERDKHLSETEYVGKILSKFKKWANERGVMLCVVAHPTKLKQKDDGNFFIPTLYSISGSAHWFNKADDGLVMYRRFVNSNGETDKSGNVQLFIQKKRNRMAGELGGVDLWWSKQTGRYYETHELRDAAEFALPRKIEIL